VRKKRNDKVLLEVEKRKVRNDRKKESIPEKQAHAAAALTLAPLIAPFGPARG